MYEYYIPEGKGGKKIRHPCGLYIWLDLFIQSPYSICHMVTRCRYSTACVDGWLSGL